MNPIKHIICILAAAAVFSGCEQILKFEDQQAEQGIVINALAVPDTVFSISVSRAFPITELPIPRNAYWDFVLDGVMIDSVYHNDAVLHDAAVELRVNGTERYTLHYDPERYEYTGDYVPQSGDRIAVNVSVDGMDRAYAETVVPSPVKLEILSCERFHDDSHFSNSGYSDFARDTTARITMRISDPGKEKNYYRLKVRSFGYEENSGDTRIYFNDLFTSQDIIFIDRNIGSEHNGWAAYFSNVFDDSLFNGQSYTFTVDTRLRRGDDYGVSVELQSITKDLYFYLKSFMYFNTADIDDPYAETIQIYSNVDNGWGILGAVDGERQVIRF